MQDNIKINQKNYARRRFLNTGIKARCLYMTDTQHLIIKTFIKVLKNIKNLSDLIGVDISDDYTIIKLVFKGTKNSDTDEKI